MQNSEVLDLLRIMREYNTKLVQLIGKDYLVPMESLFDFAELVDQYEPLIMERQRNIRDIFLDEDHRKIMIKIVSFTLWIKRRFDLAAEMAFY